MLVCRDVLLAFLVITLWLPAGNGSLLAETTGLSQDKAAVTRAKLIGVWEVVKGELSQGSTLELTKEGKVKLVGKVEVKPIRAEGSYELATDDTLVLTLEERDEKRKPLFTILTLTDKSLVIKDIDGKVTEFKKR